MTLSNSNSPDPGSPWLSTRRGRVLLGLLIVLLLAAVGIPLIFFGQMMMGSEPMSESQFTEATPGAQVEIAVEIVEAQADDLLMGEVLERDDDGTYPRTGQMVRIRWQPGSTSIVMGQQDDVEPGAVLQVRGIIDPEGVLDADRIVVLTSSVTVP